MSVRIYHRAADGKELHDDLKAWERVFLQGSFAVVYSENSFTRHPMRAYPAHVVTYIDYWVGLAKE